MTEETESAGTPEALPIQPAAIRAAVIAELAAFESVVRELSVEVANKPSAVEGWSNLDVVAHVQLMLVLYAQLLSAGARGLTAGALGKAFGSVTKTLLPAAAGAFNAVNSALPHALTGTLAPEAVMGQLHGSARTLRSRLELLDSSDFTKPIYYRGGPWPLSFFLGAVLNELAIHGWDIQSRLSGDAHLGGEARAMLPWFYWSGTSFMLRLPKATSGTVAISLIDPELELSWEIDVMGTRQTRGMALNPTTTIRGESGTFLLVLAGRITPDDAIRTTSIAIEGDEPLARRFLSSWRVV